MISSGELPGTGIGIAVSVAGVDEGTTERLVWEIRTSPDHQVTLHLVASTVTTAGSAENQHPDTL